MLRQFTLRCLFVLLLAVPVSAFADDAPASLVGNWSNVSYDGVMTQLEIDANGMFVYREQHSGDLRRSYMCGNWEDDGDALALDIQTRKDRTSAGIIEQALGHDRSEITIRSRSDSTLIVIIESRTVVLTRTGSA